MQEPVTDAKGAGYRRGLSKWGRGVNFGSCFAHEAASERACPLLYVGGGSVKIENRWRVSYGIRHTPS
jgi:uncharacterized protein with PIN domain